MARRKQSARGRSRLNGEGTISGPRKDGRYVGAFYVPTSAGTRKRVYVYGRTREETGDKLIEEQAKAARGIPVSAQSWKLGPYLDYWLELMARRSCPGNDRADLILISSIMARVVRLRP
jgi:hypothetical protein